MSRKLTGGMAAALERTQQVAADIRGLQGGRPQLEQLPLDTLVPSPFQARLDFTGLETLAADIRANGVLQPVLVRPLQGGQFELVAGERRWRASRLAGQSHIPAVVRPLDDTQARLYGLKENLERQDLNAYEITRAALDLMALSLGRNIEEVTQLVSHRGQMEAEIEEALLAALEVLGKSLTLKTFQRHYLPLLNMPPSLLEAIRGGAPYAAVTLLTRATPEQQRLWLPLVQSGQWSVRDVEKALRESQPPRRSVQVNDVGQSSQRISSYLKKGHLDQLSKPQQRRVKRLLGELEKLLNIEA